MKIWIYCYGKIKNAELKKLESYYQKLCQKYFSIQLIELKDQKESLKASDIDLKRNQFINVLLSSEGKSFSSENFSIQLDKWSKEGQNIAFYIGNAFGFDQSVKSESDLLLSLSPMTFPHEMVRVLLFEQLFRCGDILVGGKYHK